MKSANNSGWVRLSGFLVGVLLLSAAAAFYIRSSHPQPVIQDCPDCNLVVIAIDTLRADHLPFYGYQRDTAPFMSSLAAKSFLFDKAYSPSSWTAPAAASYFTSAFPSEHGVITGFSATRKLKAKGTAITLNRIPQEFETIGEYAKKSGFTTIAVADNLNIGKEIGFDRGFDYFKKYRNKGADKVNQQVNEFLEQAPKSHPYFLYIHYMDPHEPFHRRGTFYENCAAGTSGSEQERTVCAYDSEVRYTDGHIAELFEKHNWLKNSVVVILSDHGEEFWDHGKQGHGTSLYTELIHVPFMIYHPVWQGRKVKRNVSTVDLVPTVASLLNGPKSERWKGIDLLPVMHQKIPPDSRPILSERLRHPESKPYWSKRSVVVDDRHLIRTDEKNKDTLKELYDLINDFKEKNDLLPGNGEQSNQLTAVLEALSPIDGAKEGENIQVEADQELLNELKTLGYIN